MRDRHADRHTDGKEDNVDTQQDASGAIDAYIATFQTEVQERLHALRAVIHAAAPEAVETFSYQMPTFALEGNLVHFAAFARHIGFYPAPSGIAAFQERLSRYKGAKGSVQFPHDQPLPLDLVTEIVRFRVEENLAVAAAKADRRRSPSHRPNKPQD
jgi:uncharacterized protein YdhG (YjbR/CyaY superfamily)